MGDPVEVDSIRSVFGGRTRQHTLYMGSVKANIGHCGPAAGVAGLLKVLVMLRHGHIPPQIHYDILNPKIAPLSHEGMAISRSLQPWNIPFRAALVNSYGAAGSNAALICCDVPRQYFKDDVVPAAPKTMDPLPSTPMYFPLLLTAASETSLLETTRALGLYLERNAGDLNMRLVDVAFTLNNRRQRQKYIASVKANTMEKASQLVTSLSRSDVSMLSTVSYPPKPVVFVFSGQCARCWIDGGAKPSAVIGHSLGELTALSVSGVLSLADSISLIATRAHLIETKWGADKGSMLSVECTVHEVEMLLAAVKGKHDDAALI